MTHSHRQTHIDTERERKREREGEKEMKNVNKLTPDIPTFDLSTYSQRIGKWKLKLCHP